ncbi:hypothetical protein MNEG_8804, partial [Monoraphidium neglectum]
MYEEDMVEEVIGLMDAFIHRPDLDSPGAAGDKCAGSGLGGRSGAGAELGGGSTCGYRSHEAARRDMMRIHGAQ